MCSADCFPLIVCISLHNSKIGNFPTAGKRKMQGRSIPEKVTADDWRRGEDEGTHSARSTLDNRRTRGKAFMDIFCSKALTASQS